MHALRTLWDLYRNKRYRNFGITPKKRIGNYTLFLQLMLVAGIGSEDTAELVQLAYRHRRPYGVSMAEVLTRLTKDVSSGVHPEFLAITYGGPVRMNALQDWNNEL